MTRTPMLTEYKVKKPKITYVTTMPECPKSSRGLLFMKDMVTILRQLAKKLVSPIT